MRPIGWLPGALKSAARGLRDKGAREMDELPDEALSDLQLRVKNQTILGEAFFDAAGAAQELAGCAYPLYFLDFETANPAVPIWAGTQPYAQIPFQFSCHTLEADGTLGHCEFLLASGEDPCRPFAEALLCDLGTSGTVVVYNAAFERGRVNYLARRYPDLAEPLAAIVARMFDLQPVAKRRYYHPGQKGSWSIKQVLPCLAPELSYDDLGGVQNGEMAIEAYLEAISDGADIARKEELVAGLRRYCRLDTLAMAAIWARFVESETLMRTVLAAAEADD